MYRENLPEELPIQLTSRMLCCSSLIWGAVFIRSFVIIFVVGSFIVIYVRPISEASSVFEEEGFLMLTGMEMFVIFYLLRGSVTEKKVISINVWRPLLPGFADESRIFTKSFFSGLYDTEALGWLWLQPVSRTKDTLLGAISALCCLLYNTCDCLVWGLVKVGLVLFSCGIWKYKVLMILWCMVG